MIGAIRRLGPWRIGERLGGGGYAQAYRAHGEIQPGREAALKVFDEPTYVNTFLREISALERIAGCPGTPALLDWGRDAAGRLCIVTELAPGIRLDQLLKANRPLHEAQVETMVRQLLATLACAHGQGLLHKDIKASNILIAETRTTLLDWGVAEPLGDGRAETIHAKLDIVAPECFHGRHHPGTDYYALAWLIVYAFGGGLPYRFGSVADRDYRVAAHCLERPQLPASLPPRWRPLVSRWLDKNPEQRPQGDDLECLFAAVGDQALFDARLLDSRNLGRSASYLRQAAEAGVPYAQHELAARLYKAEGRDDEAAYWLERASAAGYARATGLLGRRCDDATRARQLLATAADAGNTSAAFALARRLIAANEPTAARHWLALAADKGHARAQYEYARLLETDCQPEQAAHYLQAAAERGDEKACARLGR